MVYFLIAVAILVVLFIILYNGLVGKRNKLLNQWSQVEVQLKRRFDLIPNLVEAVKGYATHEREALEAVTESRTKFMAAGTNAEKMEADSQLSGVLSRLFAVAESYPELKANTNFLQLQEQLADAENKIAFARQFYNDVVMEYNNAVAMFPSSLIAGIVGFKPEMFFQAEQAVYEAPKVKF